MPTTYESIQTYTLGSTSSSINFNSIASSWTDLKIVLTGTADGVSVALQFNSDTGNNYSWIRLKGDGSSVTSARSSNDNRLYMTGGQGLSSNIHFFTADIFSYTSSTYKAAFTSASQNENSTGSAVRTIGQWRNTSAITTISVIAGGGAFNIGTIATLWGIKNA